MPDAATPEYLHGRAPLPTTRRGGEVKESTFRASNDNLVSGNFYDNRRENEIKEWNNADQIGYDDFFEPETATIISEAENVFRLIPREQRQRINSLIQHYGMTEEQAIAEDDRLSSKFDRSASPIDFASEAVHNHSAPLALPSQALLLYDDRPDQSMDPITFYRTYWGKYEGIYQDDLGRLDPKLVPAIRSYCQRMRLKFPERASEFAAKDYLPPVRPNTAKKHPAIVAEPGTVEYAIEKRKADQRERAARFREKRRGINPFA